jgi:CysZ protein
VASADASVPRAPGLPRRIAAGAWHVPAGFAFLLVRPRLWPLAALPAILVGVLLVLGLYFGFSIARSIDAALTPSLDRVSLLLGVIAIVLLWAGVVMAGAVLGIGAALFLTAPILDRLSRHVEAMTRGELAAHDPSLGWQVLQALRSSAYFLAAAPGVLVLSLVPIVGPFLAALWGAHALAMQETEPALSRRGLDFQARRAWHRRFRPESLGFGLAGIVVFLIPVANFVLAPLFAPSLVVGATRLVVELEDAG